MIFEEKNVVLRNGKICVLRSPQPADAQGVLSYLKLTSAETPFLIRYPEEITQSVEEEEKILGSELESPFSVMIAAVVDGRIVANSGIRCVSSRIKLHHRAAFGIAVEKEFWGLGIGSLLVNEIIGWAKEFGYEQIELEVASINHKALRLYEKYGFSIYGTREQAFKFKDGSYCSEYLLMKKLDEKA